MGSLIVSSLLQPGIVIPFVLLASIYFLIIKPVYFGPLSKVPGPALCKVSWYYLATFDIFYKRNTKIHEWHKKYGPVVCIRPGEVSVASPSFMREIYGSTGRYEKSAYFNNFIAYGERAMFSTLGYHDHQQKRKMLSSFYQATNIKSSIIMDFVRERATTFMQVVDHQKRFSKELNMFPLVNRFAFDNITRLLYGTTHGTYSLESDQNTQKLLRDLKAMQFLGPLYYNFPLMYSLSSTITQIFMPQKAGGFKAGKRLEDWTTTKISSALRHKDQISDASLLSKLSTSRDAAKESLSLDFISSELVDNVNAAQETVGVALSYFIWHLSQHPEWQKKIRDELKAMPVSEDGLPAYSDIEKAVMLEAFLKEVYRVQPGSSGRAERVVPSGGRHFGEKWIPEGTVISASTIALHQDPYVFRNPEDFQPERWLHSSAADLKQMENSFIPFGYGARICTGKAFATLQIKTLVAALYSRYSTRLGAEMDDSSMWQTGTQDALPWGLRCDVILSEVD